MIRKTRLKLRRVQQHREPNQNLGIIPSCPDSTIQIQKANHTIEYYARNDNDREHQQQFFRLLELQLRSAMLPDDEVVRGGLEPPSKLIHDGLQRFVAYNRESIHGEVDDDVLQLIARRLIDGFEPF